MSLLSTLQGSDTSMGSPLAGPNSEALPQKKETLGVIELHLKPIRLVINTEKSKTCQDKSELERHDKIFYSHCQCDECLKERELILLLTLQEWEYTESYKKVQTVLEYLYDTFSRNAALNWPVEMNFSVNRRWLSNGKYLTREEFRYCMAQDYDEMDVTKHFLSCIRLLHKKDPHQLFELICAQLRSLVIAYGEPYSLFHHNNSKDKQVREFINLTNFLIDGYETFMQEANELHQYMLELESGHMKQFGMSWNLLNKRMYQRWVYADIIQVVEEMVNCIKEQTVQTESFDDFLAAVSRFVLFDDDMSEVTRSWTNIWYKLQSYCLQLDSNDNVHENNLRFYYDVLRNCGYDGVFDESNDVLSKRSLRTLLLNGDSEISLTQKWNSLLFHLSKMESVDKKKLEQRPVKTVRCLNCQSMTAGHCIDCDCRACYLTGGIVESTKQKSSVKQFCPNCPFLTQFDVVPPSIRNHSKSQVDYGTNTPPQETREDQCEQYEYHIAWAVFKHLPDHMQYYAYGQDVASVLKKICLPDCLRTPCQVAWHIIACQYPFSFSKLLINLYKPLSQVRKDLLSYLEQPILAKGNTSKYGELWRFDLLEGIGKVMECDEETLSDIASFFAEYYLTKLPVDSGVLGELLVSNNGFLELDMEKLRLIHELMVPPESNKNEEINLSAFSVLNEVQEKLESLTLEQELPKSLPEIECEPVMNNDEIETESSTTNECNSTNSQPIPNAVESINSSKNQKSSNSTENGSGCNCCSDLDEKMFTGFNDADLNTCNYCSGCEYNMACQRHRRKETLDRLRRKLQETCTQNVTETEGSPRAISKGKSIVTAEKMNKTAISETQKQKALPPKKQMPPINLENIDEVLNYVEGTVKPKEKPKTQTDISKKAAKRAKQRQRKEDERRLAELHDNRDQFHEIFFKESCSKTELKAMKSSKKKDKKKLAELENKVKKYGRTKAKIEATILELIGSIKSNNPDFRFAYLPTREEQQAYFKQREAIENGTAPNETHNIVFNSVAEQQFGHPNPQSNSEWINHKLRPNYPANTVQENGDPSKTMVTIRRINDPYAEPRVTVTAKGTDDETLLYTFVNGQLVPARNSDGSLAKLLEKPSLYSQYHPQTIVEKNTNTKQVPVKEPKKESAKNTMTKNKQPQQQHNLKQKEQNIDSKTNCKNTTRQEEPVAAKLNTKNAKDAANLKSKNQKMQNNQTKTIESQSIKNNSKEVQKNLMTNVKNNKSKSQIETVGSNKKKSVTEKTQLPESKSSIQKPKATKTKIKKKYTIDPEYKNNQFGLLDDSSICSETDEEDDDYYVQSPVKLNVKSNCVNESCTTLKQLKSTSVNATNCKQVGVGNNKSKNDTRPSHHTQIIDSPPFITPNLTKKQLKKLAQQQKRLELKNSETSDFSSNLLNSTKVPPKTNPKGNVDTNQQNKKYQLNSDTTIELSYNDSHSASSQANDKYNIMDQLNRGVNVEGLQLPPGITLTRVNPESANAIRAKRATIDRLSKPIVNNEEVQHTYTMPSPYMVCNPSFRNPGMYGPSNPVLGMGNADQNGIITVETSKINNQSKSNSNRTSQGNEHTGAKPKTKKNKKKQKGDQNSNSHQNDPNKMVTLKNPMFQPMGGMMGTTPTPTPDIPNRRNPQDIPAAIIKNDNGMFTIRNPALHHALQMDPSMGSPPTGNGNGNGNVNSQYPYLSNNMSYYADSFQSANSNGASVTPKKQNAIGSERKAAQEARLSPNLRNPLSNMHSPTPYLNTFNTQSHSIPTQTNCFNPDDRCSPNVGNYNYNMNTMGYSSGYNGMTGQCAPSMVDRSASPGNNLTSKYNDLSFLRNLQPGQRLNSEVTIHNVHESKFLRNQTAPQPNNVEIRRVSSNDLQTPIYNNSGSPLLNRLNSMHDMQGATALPISDSNVGNIFSQNRTISQTELRRNEQDAESYNGYDYFYNPTQKKEKVATELQNILATYRNMEHNQRQQNGEINRQTHQPLHRPMDHQSAPRTMPQLSTSLADRQSSLLMGQQTSQTVGHKLSDSTETDTTDQEKQDSVAGYTLNNLFAKMLKLNIENETDK